MTEADISRVEEQFASAARRCVRAGFEVLELHMGHGYLLHQFLSPLANRRTDDYGGSFEARTAFAMRLVNTVRAEWPQELPLFVRLSATASKPASPPQRSASSRSRARPSRSLPKVRRT